MSGLKGGPDLVHLIDKDDRFPLVYLEHRRTVSHRPAEAWGVCAAHGPGSLIADSVDLP